MGRCTRPRPRPKPQNRWHITNCPPAAIITPHREFHDFTLPVLPLRRLASIESWIDGTARRPWSIEWLRTKAWVQLILRKLQFLPTATRERGCAHLKRAGRNPRIIQREFVMLSRSPAREVVTGVSGALPLSHQLNRGKTETGRQVRESSGSRPGRRLSQE